MELYGHKRKYKILGGRKNTGDINTQRQKTKMRTKEKCCFGAARYILGLPLPSFSDRGIKLISPETLRLLQDLLLVLVQMGPEDFLLRYFSK